MSKKKHVTKGRIYQQRHRAETVRKEVVLNAAYPEDRTIIDFLNTLGRGEFSDVFREAMLLYIEHLNNPPRKVSDDFVDWMCEIKEDLETLKSRPVMAAIYPEPQTKSATVIEQPPTLPEVSASVASSGIDMSRPRPRAKPAVMSAPPAPAEPEELSEADAIRLAKIMANSIKRAQPGRG